MIKGLTKLIKGRIVYKFENKINRDEWRNFNDK